MLLKFTPFFRQRAMALVAVATIALGSQFATEVHAQPQSEMKPVAVIAVEGYNDIVADIDFVGNLAGQSNPGQQLEGMLAMLTQGQGIQGLDKEQPWGAVVLTDGFEFSPIVCLPVTDLDAILTLLQAFGINGVDASDGIIEIEIPNQQQSVFIKHVDNWAFVAQSPEILENSPENPAKLLKGLSDDYDLGVRFMLQNIPDMYREMAVQQLQAGAEQGLEREPGESDEVYEARRKGVEVQIEQLAKTIREMDEVAAGIKIDNETGSAHLDFISSALPGTDAALELSAYKPGKTDFAGCVSDDAAIRWNLTVDSPAELLEKNLEITKLQIQSFRQQVANAINQEADLPNDEAREVLKEAANELLNALEATALTGHFDTAGYVEMSPSGISLVAGGFVKSTDKIEAALKKIVTLSGDKPDFTGAWGTDSHKDLAIHTLSVPIPEDEDKARQFLGENLDLALGLGDDKFFFTAGKDCVDKMKQAIDACKSTGSTDVKPFQLTIALQPILKMAADFDDSPGLVAFSQILSDSGEDLDKILATVESVDGKMRVRFHLEKNVLEGIGASISAQEDSDGDDF